MSASQLQQAITKWVENRGYGFRPSCGTGWCEVSLDRAKNALGKLLWLASAGILAAACSPAPESAREDGPLTARVAGCVPLLYADGGDPAVDRPPHVRAGSALAWTGSRFVVVQDDLSVLAVSDRSGAQVQAVHLPDGADRNDKSAKLDFEAAFAHDDRLFAFGSGSLPVREKVVIVDGLSRDPDSWAIRIVEAPSLYAALRNNTACSGSELNIEGAAVLGDRVRFLQRGNGAPRNGLEPVNAACIVSLAGLLSYLDDPASREPPAIESVRQIDAGILDGVPLTITDGAAFGDEIVFLAVAEDSPDALRDGPVTGVVVGVIGEGETAPRTTPLVTVNGIPYTGKTEGIVPDPVDPGVAWVVTDRDDPDVPAELCRLELGGLAMNEAAIAAASSGPGTEPGDSAGPQTSAAQREIDEIHSLLAMAVVYKDWQPDKVRGHNIGSVLVDPAGKPVFWGRNTRYITGNGSDHGEIRLMHNYLSCSDSVEFLNEQTEHPYPGARMDQGFTLYTTLDPCVMCTGMMLMTKLSRAVYVQADPEYGDIAGRLASGGGSHPPYPVRLSISQSTIPEAGLLDAGYRAWGKADDITYYLRSEDAHLIFEAATLRLRGFESKHGNQAVVDTALRYLDDVVDGGFQPDMSLECPAGSS